MVRDGRERMIGLVDSGVGGLTIQREILDLLPNESTVYFADTGRAPYGSKSEKTILRYAKECFQFLLKNYPVKLVVLACHTVSAFAYEQLKDEVEIPVLEIIGPSVNLALRETRSGRIGVIGTESLINSGVYQKRLKEKSDVEVFSQSCPLLMPLSEEGWFREAETYTITRKYIAPLVDEEIDTLILGCTHYPPLIDALRAALPDYVKIVNPAAAVAEDVARMLQERSLQAPGVQASHLYVVTDNPERFKRVGERYLGRSMYYVRLVSS
ncbi:glutamate racemase [Candidatus Bathyarchaeota archaeon]|nr:glutamate racemase [Candidatus Bathyarchaeota archaeon]